jgi:hypothetical protein
MLQVFSVLPVPNFRYPVYFQINEGAIVEDSILVDDRETLQVRNIKRGLISAFQFHILETDQYENPVEQVLA